MNLCFSEDDFTRSLSEDRGMALWQVRLSDGRIVTMDDGRPGEEIPSAWIRLGLFIRETGLRITKMWLKFRGRIESCGLPENADAYFFARSIITDMAGNQANFYVVGYETDGRLFVETWSVPSLILVMGEQRDQSKAGESLIRNPKCQSETGRMTR